ncbi:hypothetical protein L208DRAFT_1542145 [Tricholoma matsutake]|nr:hypothetical protein L208DRAFT_1542145 [Tricholoma matsutake 945]
MFPFCLNMNIMFIGIAFMGKQPYTTKVGVVVKYGEPGVSFVGGKDGEWSAGVEVEELTCLGSMGTLVVVGALRVLASDIGDTVDMLEMAVERNTSRKRFGEHLMGGIHSQFQSGQHMVIEHRHWFIRERRGSCREEGNDRRGGGLGSKKELLGGRTMPEEYHCLTKVESSASVELLHLTHRKVLRTPQFAYPWGSKILTIRPEKLAILDNVGSATGVQQHIELLGKGGKCGSIMCKKSAYGEGLEDMKETNGSMYSNVEETG